ncbi:MAG: Plug domain-containing protein, partial [Paramuribaculum sp.]|nr:Plug domain-containing protein [Paramuribaculum sp.]
MITPADSTVFNVYLQPNDPLAEVVMTAREKHSASSASVIDTTAMEHLQPSSFADLLELLPGRVSKDPSMGTPNVINLRTAVNVTPTDDYMTSAIGTSFVIDGVPVNNNAVMQTTPDSNHSDRET